MNNDTQVFIEGLKSRPDILGIILFGSWARGNNRPDSDVDLVVILTEGFRRTVEYKNNQAFEIIYTTDVVTANLILSNKVFALTEVCFDFRRQWTPATKQRLSKIKNLSMEFYSLLEQFYRDDVTIKDKHQLARKMIPIVFNIER